MSEKPKEVKQVVRAVKYKQNERDFVDEVDFLDEVDLKSLLQKLHPEHDEKLEVIIRRVKG
jgi:hypothetical protein